MFDQDYDAGLNASKKRPFANILDGADFIQIVPDGDDLLLVPAGTAGSVIEVNEQGIVRATDLQLPPGYLIRSLLSIDGAYWTVSTYGHAELVPQKAPMESSPVFSSGPIFQFNSFDGSVIRRIDSPKKLYNNVLCA